MADSSPTGFVSYSDWLGSNADAERSQLDTLVGKAQSTAEGAIGDAYKAGASGGNAGTKLQSYGDFVNSLGDASYLSATANAQNPGGNVSWLDALGMQSVGGDQMKQATTDYNQLANASNTAYQKGAADTAATTPEARAQQAAATRAAGYGWNTNTDSGRAGFEGELSAGKKAQQAALDAGAQYRLSKERAAFEADQKRRANIERGVSDVLNPIGGLGDMAGEWNRGFGGNNGTVFGKGASFIQDPFGLGGNAHSGFGPGGKFGSPFGMGDASKGDPFGQYDESSDAGFQQWLKDNGYDSSGHGNGY